MREDKLKASCHTRYIVWWPRSASFLPFITTSYRPSDITRVTWLDFVKLGRKEDQTCWLDHQLITIIRFIIIFSNFSVSSACHYFCHYFLRLLVIIKFIFFIIYTFLQKNHHHFHHHWFWRSGKVEKYLSWQLRDVSHSEHVVLPLRRSHQPKVFSVWSISEIYWWKKICYGQG